ncbi:hypothetical protein A244_03550, partial [Pseudomonas syringae pv. actinidiae ICMP 18807]
VGPLRRKFPDVGWSSLSITLPDAQDNTLLPREPDASAGDANAAKPKEAPKDAAKTSDPAAEAEALAAAATAKAAADEERNK